MKSTINIKKRLILANIKSKMRVNKLYTKKIPQEKEKMEKNNYHLKIL